MLFNVKATVSDTTLCCQANFEVNISMYSLRIQLKKKQTIKQFEKILYICSLIYCPSVYITFPSHAPFASSPASSPPLTLLTMVWYDPSSRTRLSQ